MQYISHHFAYPSHPIRSNIKCYKRKSSCHHDDDDALNLAMSCVTFSRCSCIAVLPSPPRSASMFAPAPRSTFRQPA